ncbi:MAG TPA: hypothetical protein VIJ04_22435 [Xanthobacteraceae bacterium]
MDVKDISRELSKGGLSRRGLSDRLKALGIGFGAAFALGMTGAHAATAPDAGVALKSTNPVIDNIIQGPQMPTANVGTPMEQTAWYHRHYFRGYFRYARFYQRWYHRW